MGYWINKAVWFLMSPLNMGLILVTIGIWMSWRGRGRDAISRWGRILVSGGGLVILLFSLPITVYVLGFGLERNYVERDPKDVQMGDVALDLSGTWRRAWYAAELVKARRVTMLISTGVGVDRLDAKLIRDLGVKEPTLVLDPDARNTEENIKNAKKLFTARWMRAEQSPAANFRSQRPRVLVVTTAVHMPRSMLLMKKYWPEAVAIPAPTEFMVRRRDSKGIGWGHFVPSLCSLEANLAFFHEYLGYVAYRWLKR